MTATEFARFLKARRIGKGKWQARCPAHPDRKPSLAIAEGRKGILLKCMSHGCETKDILGALGMTFADLFEGKPVDHVMMRQIRAAEEKHDRERRARRAMMSAAEDEACKWDRLSHRLAQRMAHGEDIDAAYFHRALDETRRYMEIADIEFLPNPRGEFSIISPELKDEQRLLVEIYWSHYTIWDAADWVEAGKPWPAPTIPKMDPHEVMRQSVEIARKMLARTNALSST